MEERKQALKVGKEGFLKKQVGQRLILKKDTKREEKLFKNPENVCIRCKQNVHAACTF